jgi:hypothetical protein
MITNQPSWSGHFGLVVTTAGYGAGGPGSVPAMGMCGVTLFPVTQFDRVMALGLSHMYEVKFAAGEF